MLRSLLVEEARTWLFSPFLDEPGEQRAQLTPVFSHPPQAVQLCRGVRAGPTVIYLRLSSSMNVGLIESVK